MIMVVGRDRAFIRGVANDRATCIPNTSCVRRKESLRPVFVTRDNVNSDASSNRQWTLGRYFTLQLPVAPLFLSPVDYSRDEMHPYVLLCSVIFPPTFYCVFLSYVRLRKLFRSSSIRKSLTYTAGRTGVRSGLLFCILALGPLGVFAPGRVTCRSPSMLSVLSQITTESRDAPPSIVDAPAGGYGSLVSGQLARSPIEADLVSRIPKGIGTHPSAFHSAWSSE